MTRLSQRSRRALAALIGMLSIAVWSVRAPGQAAPVYTTSTGQRFSLPSSMRSVAAPPGSHAELAFSDGTPEPLWLFVTTRADARQPFALADSAARQKLVTGVSSGARALLRDFTISEVKLGESEPKPRRFTFSMTAEGPSLASRMLAEPEQGPTWQAVRSANQDDNMLRCLLAELLNGLSAVDARTLSQKAIPAAISCRSNLDRVQRFIRYIDPRAFAPSRWQLTALAATGPSGLFVLWVAAPGARAAEGGKLAQALAAELAASQQVTGLSAANTLGVALGALLAILSLGGGSAWVAARFTGASPTLSVATPLAVLHASALLGLCLGPADLTPALVQLAVYVLASACLFRPLQRWVSERSGQALVSEQTGFSTLEYSVLFMLVLVSALGVWNKLNDQVSPTAQYTLGLGAGILQGYTPGGFIAPHPAASKPFELGHGLGQLGASIIEAVAGPSAYASIPFWRQM